MKMNTNLLTERITLLYKKTTATSTGESISRMQFGNVWAFVAPIGRYQDKAKTLPFGMKLDRSKPIYRVIIRAFKKTSDTLKKDSPPCRQWKINALGWKHKEFDLLFPFAAFDRVSSFLESLCVEMGEEND